MKNKLFYSVLFSVILFYGVSCSSGKNEDLIPEPEIEEPIPGIDNSQRAIELEENQLTISGDKNVFFVKTKNGSWYIDYVTTSDETGVRQYENELYVYDDGLNQYNRFRDTLSYDWFTVSRSLTDIYGLHVDLDENNTENSRTIFISLITYGSALYCDSLIVTQNSK